MYHFRRLTRSAAACCATLAVAGAVIPTANAAQWQDATIAPGETIALTALDDEGEQISLPAKEGVSVSDSTNLPAGWSVTRVRGELLVSAPGNAPDDGVVTLTVIEPDSDNGETKHEIDIVVDAPAGETGTKTSTTRQSAVPEPNSSSGFLGSFFDRLAGFFA